MMNLVYFDESRKCFADCKSNKRVPGLTHQLKNVFYPRYWNNRNRSRKVAVGITTTDQPKCLFVPYESKTIKEWVKGIDVGTDIDREITKHAQIKAKNDSTIPRQLRSLFCDKESETKNRVQPRVRYLLKHLHGLLEMMSLQIISSQVPVCDRKKRIATAVDLLCYNHENKEVVVVEIKVGFNATLFSRHSKKAMVRVRGHSFFDCPFNQHQLQLACTNRMFECSFKAVLKRSKFRIGAPLLIILQQIGIFVYILDERLHKEGSTQILRRLYRHRKKMNNR